MLVDNELMQMNKPALVCFSGGQDSTTCLYLAKKNFSYVEAVIFRYGQRHENEVAIAVQLAAEAGVPYFILDIPLSHLSSNALTDLLMAMDEEKPADSFPNTFVPGRNMLFLTYAAILARSHGIYDLVIGVSEADYSGYPDCREAFIRSLNETLNLAMDEYFVIHTPLINSN
jgi:7-cyano-7-deazaguanine synthase